MISNERRCCDNIDAQSRSPSINDIPDGALLKIFAAVNFCDRHNVLPLVCRSWRQLCSSPTIWKDINLDQGEELESLACRCPEVLMLDRLQIQRLTTHLHESPAFVSWLQSVAHEVQNFSFRALTKRCWTKEWFSTVFDILPETLSSLKINFSTLFPIHEFVSIPVVPDKFTALKTLELTRMCRLNCAEIQNLTSLTALESITLAAYRSGITYQYPWEPPLHPLPSALSTLTSLRHLSVETRHLMFSMQATDFIANLTQLTSLRLVNCRPENVVSGIPLWTQLRALELGDTQSPLSLVGVWDELLSGLQALPQLRSLQLEERLVSSILTNEISSLVGLTRLSLQWPRPPDTAPTIDPQETAPAVIPESLPCLTNLKELHMWWQYQPDEKHASLLAQMTWLTSLKMESWADSA